MELISYHQSKIKNPESSTLTSNTNRSGAEDVFGSTYPEAVSARPERGP